MASARHGHAATAMQPHVQLPIAIPANFGYRFYAHHLNQYYTCDWALPSAARAA